VIGAMGDADEGSQAKCQCRRADKKFSSQAVPTEKKAQPIDPPDGGGFVIPNVDVGNRTLCNTPAVICEQVRIGQILAPVDRGLVDHQR